MNQNRGNFAKRILVTALTLSLIGGSVDLSGFTVFAQTTQEEMTQEETTPGKAAQGGTAQEKAAQGESAQEKQTKTTTVTVTGFAELSENIREQQLPVGAQESDIYLPESLMVTVEKTVVEDKSEADEEQSGTKGDSASQKESGTAGDTGSEEQGGTEGSTGSEGQGAADGSSSGEQGGTEGSTGSEGQGAADGSSSGEQGGTEGSTGSEGQGAADGTGSGEQNGTEGNTGSAGQGNTVLENGNNSTDNGQAAGEQGSSGEGLVGRIADWFFAPMTVHAAENPAGDSVEADAQETTGNGDTSRTTEEVSLTGITWELNQDESDAAEFDASEASNGFCYVYTPVLPDTDKDGNTLAVGDDVELPAIYGLVGEPQLALLNAGDVAEVTVGGTPTTYPTVSAALDAIQTAINNASGDAAQNITLKFLADATVTGLVHSLNGNGKNVSLTIDMNGKTVGFDWENEVDEDNFQLEMTDIKVFLTGGGTLSAAAYIKEKAALEVKGEADINLNGTLYIDDGGTATLNKLCIYYGGGGVELLSGSSCKIKGGQYIEIDVKSTASLEVMGGTYIGTLHVRTGAKLKVSGGEANINTLYPYPSSDGKRAAIELSGGSYTKIAAYANYLGAHYLEEESYKCAIVDMLASGYKFYNSSDNETEVTPERTATELQNVKVLSEPEVIVSFQITKKDGTTETKNFASWDKAMSYLSGSGNETEFATWKKVEILLQKDASTAENGKNVTQMVSSDELSAELVLRSAGDAVYTLSGSNPSSYIDIALYTNGQKLTVENIKTNGATLKVVDGTVTIKAGAVLAARGSSVGGTIDVERSTLILEDGASVSSTNTNEDVRTAIHMADTGILRIQKGAQITNGTVYISGFNNESIVVIEEGAKLSAIESASNANPSVYCNLDSAESGVWRAMTGGKVYFPIDCNGVTLEISDNNITKYDGKIYGRFYSDPDTYSSNTKIEVPDTVCSYQTANGTTTAVDADHAFQMPSAKVTLLKHSPDASSGSCPYCGKTDLAKAYKAGKLQIKGLTGRTYDSQPQILTGITLTDTDGRTKTLTGPQYYSGYTLAQDSTNPVNAAIGSVNDYDLIYENNINAYDKKPGDSGFDAAKAPKVTIIGHGNYTGTIEYYFTIGQGTLQMFNFGAWETEYNGYSQGALHYGIVGYALDETDREPRARLYLDGPDQNHKCAKVSTGKTIDNAGYNSVAAMKIEYSTDNGSTWTEITENNQDTSKANYQVKDAGTYEFQVRVTDGDNAAPAVQSLTATIQPKALTDPNQIVLNSSPITAYYTGKRIIPAGDLIKITAPYIPDSNGKTPYVLEKDKDFTVSAENNTEVTDKATLTITGIGNYTGTLTKDFSIVYAFELAQTTASSDHWYNTDVPAVFGVNDTTGDTADALNQLIYRSVTRADNTYNMELSGDVKLYSTLQDAVADTNEGYTFTGEGKQTVTLYGRDTARGYIANPIAITVQIDKTAPTWADKDGNTEEYGIEIRNNWWRTLLNKVSFGILYNDATLDMKIHANDKKNGVNEVSGIDKYYYYVDTITNAADDMAAKTKTELDALAEQGKFQAVSPDSGLFSGEGATITGALSNSKNYVIYAYAVDKAGNQSDYICTEGLVVDNQAPELTVTAPTQEEGTLKDSEVTLLIQSDEAAELVYFYQSEYYADKQIPFVEAVNAYIDKNVTNDSRLPFAQKKNGEWVSEVEVGGKTPAKVTDDSTGYLPLYCVELKAGQNSITLKGLNVATRADVWMVAIDKAGNITDTKTLNFTTTKEMPRITTLPQLSGVYGDTPVELTVTPGVAKNYGESEVDGTWVVVSDSTEKLEVGTTEQCTVKFIPKNTDYAEAYVKVTPTITKRPLRIKVADMTKAYQEQMPEIAFDIPISNIGKVQLAAGDTKETIKSSLHLVTEATEDSEVGTYSFTVTSDSQNYEVTTEYYENLSDLVSTIKRQGTLTIIPAAGELTQGAGYTDTKTVTYGDAPFSLDVMANHTESRIAYVVTDEKDAEGNTISADEHIVFVSADGMVTINRAGSAKIQISLPASKNYTAPTALTVTVTAERKDFAVPEQSRSYLYDRDSSDTIDLAGLLPKDCGKAAYTISKNDSIFEAAEVKDGKLSYKVKSGTIGTSGEIEVTVTTDNYTINGSTGNSGQITVKAALVDRKPVEPKTAVSVKNSTLTYGEPVSRLQFNAVAFVEQGTDKAVAGKLQWDTPDAVPDTGVRSVAWTFTPENDEYQIVTGSLTITVERAVPKVGEAPVPGAYVYHPTNTLASDKAKAVLNAGAKVQGVVTDAQGRTVAGSWSWKEQSEVPNAGTHTYTAVFTPTDAVNYETIEKPVTLTVEKAYVSIKDKISSLSLPSYKHGEYLYNQELTTGSAYYAGKGENDNDVDKNVTTVLGKYVWAAPETQVKYTDGMSLTTGYQAPYELEFIPDDTTNYAGTMENKNGESSQKMAWVSLYKADNPPYRPGAQMTVAHTCQKVSDVKLPQNWKWSGNDGNKPLEDNQAVSAVAEYTGTDAECYLNTFYTISITRSTCDHAQTEVRNAKAATCSSEGSTGETWCKQCDTKLDDGCVLAKDATKHETLTETVVRQATTSQTGLKVQECSACHYRKEVTIPKLSGGSTSQGGGSTQQPGTSDGNGGSDGSTSGGNSDGGSGSSTSGGNDGGNGSGQSTTTIQNNTKPQTPAQQPAERENTAGPADTERNRAEQTPESSSPETGAPFIKGENGKEGWDVIHDELEAAVEGETVSVDMNGATTVPGEILGNISGKDITLVLDMGDGITWSINGKSFTEANPGDIDFGVTYGEQAGKNIPVDVINNVTGERYSMNLTLAYDGEFGFSAVLSINMDSSNAGLYANLFYYNPESGELEFMCAGQIGEDGSTELTFTHASDYTIVIDTEPMNLAEASDAVETEDAVQNQETTDTDAMTEAAQDKTDKNNGWMLLLAAIAAAAVATGVVVLKKRRKLSAK